MKKGLSIFLLATGVFLVGWGAFNLLIRSQTSESEIVSPCVEEESRIRAAKFQEKMGESGVSGKEVWQPVTELGEDPPEIEARAASVADFTTGKIIFKKNIQEKLPIASLVKMMTAVLALEYGDLEEEILVSEEAANVGEAFMGLEAGEKLKLVDLLYGMMLPSGNDAAEAIAEGLAGRREVFIQAMNKKAEEMGLKDTDFINPTGLDEDENGVSKSTVDDLILLSHYGWTNFPKFRQIVGTKEWRIEETGKHKAYFLEHTLGLEETYPGMKGIKPGNTWEAGFCLVGLAEKKGHEILVVLLDSPSPKDEVVALFDWGFKQI